LYKFFLAAVVLMPVAALVRADVAGSVVVTDPWVRALPPTQANTAAYMVITNNSGQAVEILAARSDVASRVEFHTTREVEGYQRMQQLEQLQLPAEGTLELAPGGTHLMLLGLQRMPVAGEQVELCLQLSAGDETCFMADVRKDGAGASHEHHHH
jgi:copper(I)-binding protein